MKLLNVTLGLMPVLAFADVIYLTTVKSLPGKGDATNAFLANTMKSFHQIKPAGQTDLFGIRAGKDTFVVLEQYTDDHAAIEWTYNETHIEACKPMATLLDSSTASVQSNGAPWAIEKFIAFLQPQS